MSLNFNQKKNILVVIDSLEIGGAEKMALNISNSMVELGFNVVLVVTRNEGPLNSFLNDKVTYYFLNKTKKGALNSIKFLTKILWKHKIDIIHAHSSSIFLSSFLKIFRPNTKLIWHDHLGDRNNAGSINLFYILFSIFFDGVICVNKQLENWSKKNLLVSDKSIITINNFPKFQISINNIKKNPINEPISILKLSNGRYPKDHHTLVKALMILKNKYSLNFHVKFAGLFLNDNYAKTLNDLIIQGDLTNEIEFVGQINDPTKLLTDADIGILSSKSEGLPVSILEYGYFGLPVISTSVGQCPEVLSNGQFGLLIDPEDVDSLASELKFLIESEYHRSYYGLKLQNHIKNNYSFENFLEGFLILTNKGN